MRRQNTDEGPSTLQWFLDELDRSPGKWITKDRVRHILRSMTGQRLTVTKREMVKPERMRIAVELIGSGITATEARYRLAIKLGVSKRTAERLVDAALSERARHAMAARANRQGGTP